MAGPRNIYEAFFGDEEGRGVSSAVAAVDLGKDGNAVTYAELRARVDAARATAHIEDGDKVALVMPNSLELVVGLLACWAQGAATAPLNPAYTSTEFRDLFEDLGVKTALVLPGDEKVKGVLREASPDLRIVEIDLTKTQSFDTSPSPVNQDNGIALYLHTSGTTGKPKAVPLRHSNLIAGARNIAETYALSPRDRTYLLQVLFHIHGIIAALLAPLTTGGSIVIPPGGKLDASRAWADFMEYKCNWVTGTPSILQTLLAASCPDPIPDIRFIRSCSSPLLPTVFNALRKRFDCPVIEAYAMTEASHQMCSNRLDLFAPGIVGPEAGGAKICIWDGGDHACALGTEGEVCVSGDNVMDGYEGVSPEKNTEAFWRGKDERGNEATWFRTGDRGVLSSDGNRRLTLIGRLSEIVNRGGEKISPVEVDEAMMLASEEVKEAASFAVPDEFYGQEIEAAVVLADGSKLTESIFQALLEKRLAKFKVPKRIHFCEGTIPKGPTGKIQRKNLTQQFGVGKSKDQTSGGAGDADIYAFIDKALNLSPGHAQKNPHATLLELGADSLGLAKIVSNVQRRFGRQLDMATMFSFPRVEAVVMMVGKASHNSENQDTHLHKPAAYSLLPNAKESLEVVCRQAGVQVSDIEDAYPLSASQKMYFDVFLGSNRDTEMMWKMTRYQMAKGVEVKRLLQALDSLQRHEESLRWILAEDPKLGWITLQLRPDHSSCVERLKFETNEQARQAVESRLASCRHHGCPRTAMIFVIEIGQELEMAFIESHGFAEAQGRTQMLEALTQAYSHEAFEGYTPYSCFIQRYPANHDARTDLEFWQKEKAAAEHSEGSNWALKQTLIQNPPGLGNDRLDLVDVVRSVEGPFNKLTVQTGMTIPYVVEAIHSLSLALYFGQQEQAFQQGYVVYDRSISLRTSDFRFSSVRPVTAGYHPNFILLDVANRSLWAHFQHFKAVTQLGENRICVSNTAEIANHSAAFVWRFNDDKDEDPVKDAGSSPKKLVAGIKGEKLAFRAVKMCYVLGTRKGAEGVQVAVGFHQKWLDDRRRRDCKVELIDVLSRALKFCAENHGSLEKLSLHDLQSAVFQPR
ncbi:hypothetical protein F4778DRAFT_776311 [Xylariomycetidae sp. FL2044]|nr:hypothetical protein F4778DRAFT_776311 [Xylariomycetidae sp. FL2044]